MRQVALASTPLVAALVWTAVLLVDGGPYDDLSVFLIGFGLLTLAALGSVGMLLVGGRWARRSALAALTATIPLALVREIDPLWVAGVLASATAVAALLTSTLKDGIRKLPAAAGPPERAVLLTLALMAVPLFLGLFSWDGANVGTLVVGMIAPAAAFWYARVLPGGYYIARYAWPLLALGLAFTQQLIPALASAAAAVTVSVIAADGSVRVAFYPPRERGTAYPIPPELTPKEILDAADVDDRGRRK